MTAGKAPRIAALLGAAVCVGLLGASASSGSPQSRRCTPPHSRTILETSQLRVYSVPAAYSTRIVRVCWRATGRTRELGSSYGCDDEGCGGVHFFRAAGEMVAFEKAFQFRETVSSYRVALVDARRAKQVRSVPTGELTPSQVDPPDGVVERNEGVGPVTALAVRPDGVMAWIARNRFTGEFEVRTLTSGRRSALVASGPDIAARSLKLGATRVSWVQAGQRRSAPLR